MANSFCFPFGSGGESEAALVDKEKRQKEKTQKTPGKYCFFKHPAPPHKQNKYIYIYIYTPPFR